MSRKENALDLAKFVDKAVRVKLSGGREGDRTVLVRLPARSQHVLGIISRCQSRLMAAVSAARSRGSAQRLRPATQSRAGRD